MRYPQTNSADSASPPEAGQPTSLRNYTSTNTVLVLVLLGSLAVMAVGCGDDSGGPGTDGQSVDAVLAPDALAPDSTVGPDACVPAAEEVHPVPASAVIMTDKSGSMMGTRWTQTVAAMQVFFGDPESAELSIALQFYPDATGGCDSTCDVNACATPTVPLGTLTTDYAPVDAQENALITAFGVQTPAGGTPLSVALEGGVQWAVARQAAAPGERVSVILMADGAPTACVTDPPSLVSIAADAYNLSGVRVFTVGLGPDVDANLMQALAQAGTSGAYLISDMNLQQGLFDALELIRNDCCGCLFTLPTTVGTEPLDPARLEVVFTDGNAAVLTLPYHPSEAGCGGGAEGWFFDDPANPAFLQLCDVSCRSLRSDAAARIDLQLSCP